MCLGPFGPDGGASLELRTLIQQIQQVVAASVTITAKTKRVAHRILQLRRH